ncbi:MAG: insulinase family protein [Clostridiales bacterium]|nr:insulinase family protein [Clostridiales bacterium]
MTVKKYDSGLTVIIEPNTALRSVTAGIMVGAGSIFETPENNGISHFIEHMQFKGTATRSAAQIVSQFDRAGAAYNAFTGKEYTCFYFKSIDEKLGECFELLSDLFLNAEYAQAELDRERKVILEEINMSKDEPDGVCYDTLYKTAFNGGSLGMEILGTKDNVKRFNKPEILEYKKHNYLPSNTVIAFVGNITAAHALELVEKHMAAYVSQAYAAPRVLAKQQYKGGYGEYIHDYEQSEISIAFPALTFADGRTSTLAALDCILGSGMSSRLFQRLREKMGLVYSVYSSPWYGRTNGMFSVNVNVNVANVESSVAAVKNEIDLILKDGVTAEETEKAKMQLKVTSLFSKENPMNYMLALLRWQVMAGLTYDIDKLIAEIEAVTPEKINAMAHEIFSGKPTFAYAGKKPSAKIINIFNGVK